MTPKEFEEKLSRGNLPSVLLFEGPEEHLKQEALRRLRKAILPEGLEDLNEARLDEASAEELIAAAETLPFLSDRRLIIARDHPVFTDRNEEQSKVLADYLPNVPSTAVLLFYCVQPITKTRIRLAVQKLNGIVKFEEIGDDELVSFVISGFRDQGKECTRSAAELLIRSCGSSLSLLLQEIRKISSLHPEDPQVTEKEISLLVSPSLEDSVFRLLDALLNRQEEKTFRLMRELLLNGKSDTSAQIKAMLLRQFRTLQMIKIMQYEKKSQQEINQALSFKSPYASRQNMKQASSITNRQARDAVRLCLDTELAIRNSELPEEGSLETLLIKLLRLLRNESGT